MTIFVDSLKPSIPNPRWRYFDSCHLFVPADIDAIKDLHKFAGIIGLKKEWFQKHSDLPHYDLNSNKFQSAMYYGAELVSDEKLVECMRKWRVLIKTFKTLEEFYSSCET